jgi:hypothetical protein
MEAIMSSITQFVAGTAIALVVTVACAGIIGSAVAQSPAAQAMAQETLTNRPELATSEIDLRLGDHQQLRRLFLGN